LTIGALRYRCGCQAEFLVAIPSDAGPEWNAVVAAAADAIGATAIASGTRAFVCARCGRLHARSQTA
jgi:hypothetical protein